MAVHHQLLVSAQVEQPAGGVIRACAEGIPVREELPGEGMMEMVSLSTEMGFVVSHHWARLISSPPLRWCQRHGRWRTVCTCRHECPTAWRWRRRLLTRRSCSPGSETNSWHRLCGQWRWWPAGQSLCPTKHFKKRNNTSKLIMEFKENSVCTLKITLVFSSWVEIWLRPVLSTDGKTKTQSTI